VRFAGALRTLLGGRILVITFPRNYRENIYRLLAGHGGRDFQRDSLCVDFLPDRRTWPCSVISNLREGLKLDLRAQYSHVLNHPNIRLRSGLLVWVWQCWANGSFWRRAPLPTLNLGAGRTAHIYPRGSPVRRS
jgi:hypothetical protein